MHSSRFMRGSYCLYVYVYYFSVLDLVKMILGMFSWICKVRIEADAVGIIAKAHLSQLKIVLFLGVSTCGMSIAGIRHVDSWGGSFPTSVCMGDHEQWAINVFYVIWSIVILLLSGMVVQYGSFGMSTISSLALRILKFSVLNDQETFQLIVISLLFVFTLVVLAVGDLSRLYLKV